MEERKKGNSTSDLASSATWLQVMRPCGKIRCRIIYLGTTLSWRKLSPMRSTCATHILHYGRETKTTERREKERKRNKRDDMKKRKGEGMKQKNQAERVHEPS